MGLIKFRYVRMLLLVLPLFILLWIFSSFSVPAAGAGPLSVGLAVPTNLPVDSKFVIRVDISGVKDLNSYQLDINYDSTRILVIAVTPGEIGSTIVPIDEWRFVQAGIPGEISLKGTLLNPESVSGDGYLARLHCQVIGQPGQSSDVGLSSVQLLNLSKNALVPARVTNASLTIVEAAAGPGRIIVIVVAALVIVAIAVALIIWWRKKRPGFKLNLHNPKIEPEEDPEKLLEIMRARISKLPPRGGRKSGSNGDK